jgi:hypothetical protein
MKVLFQAEINVDDINLNYYCTDQTNINQRLVTRNFYDSSEINLYVPNSDIVIGSCLYSSVNDQKSYDFKEVTQNVWSLLSLNYEGIVGTFVVNYSVINSEYMTIPNVSTISSASGVFSEHINKNVYVTPSTNNPSRILFIIYSE